MHIEKPEDVNMLPIGFRIARILIDSICPKNFLGTELQYMKEKKLMWNPKPGPTPK